MPRQRRLEPPPVRVPGQTVEYTTRQLPRVLLDRMRTVAALRGGKAMPGGTIQDVLNEALEIGMVEVERKVGIRG